MDRFLKKCIEYKMNFLNRVFFQFIHKTKTTKQKRERKKTYECLDTVIFYNHLLIHLNITRKRERKNILQISMRQKKNTRS